MGNTCARNPESGARAGQKIGTLHAAATREIEKQRIQQYKIRHYDMQDSIVLAFERLFDRECPTVIFGCVDVHKTEQFVVNLPQLQLCRAICV